MTVHNEGKQIDAELFTKMVNGGAVNLHDNVAIVNDLNVFPIPDGDTGDNMLLTLKGGLAGVNKDSDDLSQKAKALSDGMLLGARGNSGVILSQLFHGIAEGLEGLKTATIKQFALAFERGVKRAYGSVAKPVEGTILTVAREASAHALKIVNDESTIGEFLTEYSCELKNSLMRTPELLDALAEAGVIDSGGAGLSYVIEGFCKVANGEELGKLENSNSAKTAELDFSKFTKDSVMEFGYCTEFLLQLQTCKTDVDAFDVDKLTEYLNSIGDSVVAFKTGSVIKVHVHTLKPYKALEYCSNYGEFLTVKIENMTLQHNDIDGVQGKQNTIPEEFKVKRKRRKFALVSVASGTGLINLFTECGVDYVINGGQTNNPSAEDFVKAYEDVNADHVFVFPNNKNIMLSAQQSAKIYDKCDVRVIKSKNIGQGYTALSMLDYSCDDADEIERTFNENIENVVTGMVTIAVRDTSVNGVKIQKEEYIGFTDKTMYVSSPNKVFSALSLCESLGVKDKDYVIVVYGKGAKESEKKEFEEKLRATYSTLELYTLDGGQDVYDFLVIVD